MTENSTKEGENISVLGEHERSLRQHKKRRDMEEVRRRMDKETVKKKNKRVIWQDNKNDKSKLENSK